MGLLDLLGIGRAVELTEGSTELVETQRMLAESEAEAMSNGYQVAKLKESMSELSLYLEDLNWTRLDTMETLNQGLSLRALGLNSERLRALLSINPTIKKAINARVGYIWGRGMSLNVTNNALKKRIIDNNPYNQQKLFNPAAYWKLEAALATDGNIWAQRNSITNDVILTPISHIGGWIIDPDDPTRVNFWLINYQKMNTNYAFVPPKIEYETVYYWVPAHDINPERLAGVSVINTHPVRQELSMIHLAANRQEHWILGIPDIMAVMFWTRAHKELFEAGTTFVKAQGRFAAKVVAKTDVGGAGAAATIRDTPRRDPVTGESMNYGGTAVATGGLDYQLMGKMTGGVDFGAFDPVAGLIAAGLGVPLGVLTGKSTTEIESLEQSTVNEMQMRQILWSWFFEALFGGKADVEWPKIKTEPEYRRIQSVEIANGSNTLWPDELRQLTLEGFSLDDTHDGKLPPITQQPQVAIGIALKKAGVEPAAGVPTATAPGATGVTAKGQGSSTGIGKLSDGKDSKDARNSTVDTNVKGQ